MPSVSDDAAQVVVGDQHRGERQEVDRRRCSTLRRPMLAREQPDRQPQQQVRAPVRDAVERRGRSRTRSPSTRDAPVQRDVASSDGRGVSHVGTRVERASSPSIARRDAGRRRRPAAIVEQRLERRSAGRPPRRAAGWRAASPRSCRARGGTSRRSPTRSTSSQSLGVVGAAAERCRAGSRDAPASAAQRVLRPVGEVRRRRTRKWVTAIIGELGRLDRAGRAEPAVALGVARGRPPTGAGGRSPATGVSTNISSA